MEAQNISKVNIFILKIVLDFFYGFLYNMQDICRCRVAGRARTIGNRVTVKSSSRVRIPPSPPNKKPSRLGWLFVLSECVAVEPSHSAGMLRFCVQYLRRAPSRRKTGVQNPSFSAKQKAIPLGMAFCFV